jgi:hypothetical protein
MTKPAENTTISAAAALTIVAGFLKAHGYNVTDADYSMAILVVGIAPHVVTWIVNWRQNRDPTGAVARDVGGEHG